VKNSATGIIRWPRSDSTSTDAPAASSALASGTHPLSAAANRMALSCTEVISDLMSSCRRSTSRQAGLSAACADMAAARQADAATLNANAVRTRVWSAEFIGPQPMTDWPWFKRDIQVL